MPDARQAAALWAAAAAGVQVGAALVASRAVIGELAPATLAVLRYGVAVALIAPVWCLRRRGTRPATMPWRDGLAIAALGVLQFGVPIVMLNAALTRINANLAGLLFATFPLLAMLGAVALGHERLRARTMVGVFASLAGVAVALGGGAGARSGADSAAAMLGAALALGAALGCAVCAVLYRPYLARHEALRVGVWAMTASVLALLVPALGEGAAVLVPALSPRGWALVGFVGALSGVGYLLWLFALGHAPVTRVSVFQALAPITAAVLGLLFLGEAWTWALSLGLAGVVAGLWLTTRG